MGVGGWGWGVSFLMLPARPASLPPPPCRSLRRENIDLRQSLPPPARVPSLQFQECIASFCVSVCLCLEGWSSLCLLAAGHVYLSLSVCLLKARCLSLGAGHVYLSLPVCLLKARCLILLKDRECVHLYLSVSWLRLIVSACFLNAECICLSLSVS